jgi:4-hydroxy-tetrahydrodipicolinate synthase
MKSKLNFGIQGQDRKAFELYRWFLPLLRMDTVPMFVQLTKLVEAELGMGNTRVRPPLELVGSELEQAKRVIGAALRTRPDMSASMAASTPPLSGKAQYG